ncbi:MAG TPA: putative toxin-antitoxin system toxin component, PIN family [Burkholderiales bacterium]|nr:putative toxin-antitoxin system toxin component, PIN family [Burkholderiales bacterium]
MHSAVRIVLDTNTVVSALLWGGPPYALIEAATEERVELYSSKTLLEELADVLGRPKFARQLARAQRTVADLIEQYRGLVELVEPASVTPSVRDDPDDDHVLACALAANADAIVSGDAHLQTLASYQGIPILAAAQCRQLLSSESRE